MSHVYLYVNNCSCQSLTTSSASSSRWNPIHMVYAQILEHYNFLLSLSLSLLLQNMRSMLHLNLLLESLWTEICTGRERGRKIQRILPLLLLLTLPTLLLLLMLFVPKLQISPWDPTTTTTATTTADTTTTTTRDVVLSCSNSEKKCWGYERNKKGTLYIVKISFSFEREGEKGEER